VALRAREWKRTPANRLGLKINVGVENRPTCVRGAAAELDTDLGGGDDASEASTPGVKAMSGYRSRWN